MILACLDNPKNPTACAVARKEKTKYCKRAEEGNTYYSWMYKNCRKSCGWCNPGKLHLTEKYPSRQIAIQSQKNNIRATSRVNALMLFSVNFGFAGWDKLPSFF